MRSDHPDDAQLPYTPTLEADRAGGLLGVPDDTRLECTTSFRDRK